MDENKELMPIEEIRRQVQQQGNMFEKRQPEVVEKKPEDPKNELIENMFQQAVTYEVANNEDLKNKVLDAAKTYTDTKMKTIKTNVDTEHKEANFNNRKDACESYGFNEKTTPIWATKFMAWGYNVILAIWLFIGTFSFMPIIFVAKKLAVGLKKTWIAVVFAIVIYLGIVFVPILIALCKK